MPRSGLINGFYFDAEVFGNYMQEQSCLNNLILNSGILQFDPIIEQMVGSNNNVGTIPFFLPVDGESEAKNDDGNTDNTPSELTGSKTDFHGYRKNESLDRKNIYTLFNR